MSGHISSQQANDKAFPHSVVVGILLATFRSVGFLRAHVDNKNNDATVTKATQFKSTDSDWAPNKDCSVSSITVLQRRPSRRCQAVHKEEPLTNANSVRQGAS
jgi:hypothetical protein